jgi:hypothetical protein
LRSAIEDRVDLNEDRSTEFDRDRGVVVCVNSRGTSSDVGVLVENGDVDRDGGDGRVAEETTEVVGGRGSGGSST